ncbi:hypothetical protein PTTG_27617 [Puccinia triticina 1-1 BBBD Race 1]|uniref:Uncharacterized protein n=2 Tax=Puccinia triticina TaxID=208348 RepID=A0A180GJ52_PUCT1|nr:uncharacterized protein PtA15_18A26 [Puccinia triticina]OAV92468.1 hypothetical protein PTTG_27617 [Puccinia triticina 1-1 BBBD Race 1]WAQ92971.1 hypothetical protein PtA15_18A26 [Puccinia triticina]WAR62951.1 hypothetical protein PtB15_18B33 [Puccinia triticina]
MTARGLRPDSGVHATRSPDPMRSSSLQPLTNGSSAPPANVWLGSNGKIPEKDGKSKFEEAVRFQSRCTPITLEIIGRLKCLSDLSLNDVLASSDR